MIWPVIFVQIRSWRAARVFSRSDAHFVELGTGTTFFFRAGISDTPATT